MAAVSEPSDDGAGGQPSRAETARSAVEEGPSPPRPDDPRERFWAFLCQFAVYFYLFAYLVTVLLALSVVALLLNLRHPDSPVTLTLLSVLLFGATGVGVWLLLWRCNRL